MASGKAPLTWTKRQTLVYEELTKGLKPTEIKTAHKISLPFISQVKNAMKKGEHPPVKSEAKVIPAPDVKAAEVKTGVSQNQSEVKTEEGKKQEQTITPPGHLDPETEAKLVTLPVIMPLTAIMQNWKAYLVKMLHWPADSRWQDIIDTTIYHYALSLDPPVVLQGWYIGEKAGGSPKPASEKEEKKAAGGNGHNLIDVTSPEFKKLMGGIIVETINAIQTGKMEVS